MINAYLTDSITIVRNNGYDSWNKSLGTTDIAVKGRIEYRTRLVKDVKGEEVVSMATVLLHESINISVGRSLTHEDWLTFGSIRHAVINVGQPKSLGFSGLFYEVYVA